MLYYIYKIENLINHKKYIGLTNNIERRRKRHFSDLKRQCHDNHFLQEEYNYYGEKAFSFEKVLETDCTSKEIEEYEKYYIKYYDSYYNGYNQNEGGNFGPANGGTHFTQNDIYEILSALQFCSRPGAVLAKLFNTTTTTISRIKKGINHCQYKQEYDSFSLEQQKQIYENFCKRTNFIELKANSTILTTKRKLTKEQVFMIFANEENGKRKIPINNLMQKIGVKSSNAIYDIIRGGSYKDYKIEYDKLTLEDKNKIVSLLSN